MEMDMLIEFSVSNFRSIKEKQVLSLAAAKGGELDESNTFPSGISKLSKLRRSRLQIQLTLGVII